MTLKKTKLPALEKFPFEVVLQVSTPSAPILTVGKPFRYFPWASVTKIAVSLSVMIAVQEGDLSLDEPGGPPGSTLRHLLSHTSGLAFDTSAVLARPERRRIYSNRNIELAADLAQKATHTPFPEWLEESVLMPLEMSGAWLEGSPAYGISGTIDDLSALGRELLEPTLLKPEWDRAYTSPVFPGLTGVLPGFGRQADNLWGLGVEIRGQKSPHWTGPGSDPATFGHFGQSGSFLWVDRSRGICAAFLGEKPFSKLHASVWPELNQQILDNL